MLDSLRLQELSWGGGEKVRRRSPLAPRFTHRRLAAAPDAIAPDGSEVRLLASSGRGSMAHFRLAPGGVSRAIRHRSVEELWYFVAGHGEMWRKHGGDQEVLPVHAGLSLDIPAGASFQFRAAPDTQLEAVGVTMPPWPGAEEAEFVAGIWEPTEG
jgi:mannose-6-phosphate isomerase-like protein (cupin superfamily)